MTDRPESHRQTWISAAADFDGESSGAGQRGGRSESSLVLGRPAGDSELCQRLWWRRRAGNNTTQLAQCQLSDLKLNHDPPGAVTVTVTVTVTDRAQSHRRTWTGFRVLPVIRSH